MEKNSVTRGGSKGVGWGGGFSPGAPPPLKLEKIIFFCVKSYNRFLTRNTPNPLGAIILSAPPNLKSWIHKSLLYNIISIIASNDNNQCMQFVFLYCGPIDWNNTYSYSYSYYRTVTLFFSVLTLHFIHWIIEQWHYFFFPYWPYILFIERRVPVVHLHNYSGDDYGSWIT